MKKTLALIIIFIFFSYAVTSFAKDSSKEDTSVSTPSSSKTIDYTLPYPGLLPDSPLYILKVLRDRIVSILISGPVKKANFDLLQADKRLNEGVFLFNKGEKKYSLAESTISKGENYFEKGISEIEMAKKQGFTVKDIFQRFHLASLKHKETIKGLIDKTRGDVKQRLILDERRVENFEKRTNSLMLQ